jgi:energy-coupling factor transporter ATP-binding protein EcfA2
VKLKTVHVRDFQSIWDSTPFPIDKVTCLVGKNEAGKTALIQALYRLNPIIDKHARFDVTDDYPRAEVEDYQQAIEQGTRQPATVVTATFTLDADELTTIAEHYGKDALTIPEVTLSRRYPKTPADTPPMIFNLPIDEHAVVKHLVNSFAVSADLKKDAGKQTTLTDLASLLNTKAKEHTEALNAAMTNANKLTDEAAKAAALEEAKTLAEGEPAKALRARVGELVGHKDLRKHIWETILSPRVPQFLYFNEYYQMRGHDNIQALKKRVADNTQEPSDYPLLGLIDLARLNLDTLLTTTRTQELTNKLEGASNHLTRQILKYWSQNKHLSMKFDVREGRSGDPEGMRQGPNIWGAVYDAKHLVSTNLGTRSAGFVWFFSFLAWYSSIKKETKPLVLLLDEPGLSLHGRAQEDLLRYFDEEVAPNPNHQLIYTTHSPFMVDAKRFDRVRIVQDKGIDTEEDLPRDEDGTKVLADVLDAGPDSLFPLQGALGYEIYQTLFIGPNCLIVEGASDLLYLQSISSILQESERTALDERWTITPVGGADKVPTFVALIGAQTNLNVATLIDIQKEHAQTIQDLYKRKLLKKTHVLTFADFTGAKEADIEDMLGDQYYLDLVNAEYAGSLTKKLALKDLPARPRIITRIESYLATNPLKKDTTFNHYRPARYFTEHAATLALPADALDRFDEAFTALNALLPKK